MIDIVVFIASYLGAVLLVRRMSGRSKVAGFCNEERQGDNAPLVSIIVPARNEAKTLPHLLPSLFALSYPRKEIIVVDDQSSDGTGELARKLGAIVVTALDRPAGWLGKQWACQSGANRAGGEWLLFTDADTTHYQNSLEEILRFSIDRRLDMATCLPFHQCKRWWEKLLGPFHFMLLTSTAPYGEQKVGRTFAIGQYLLFRGDFYRELGGHSSVKGEMVEDLPLANVCLEIGGRYGVFNSRPLFSVRMYDSLEEFVAGWRRNFRAGMTGSSKVAIVEMFLLVAMWTGGGHLLASFWWALPCMIGAVFLIFNQRRLGDFSVLGPVFFPFSLGLFCWISSLAAFDQLMGRALIWKGREYQS